MLIEHHLWDYDIYLYYVRIESPDSIVMKWMYADDCMLNEEIIEEYWRKQPQYIHKATNPKESLVRNIAQKSQKIERTSFFKKKFISDTGKNAASVPIKILDMRNGNQIFSVQMSEKSDPIDITKEDLVQISPHLVIDFLLGNFTLSQKK